MSYPGAPKHVDGRSIYVHSMRRILVAFAYYSWPHPDPGRLLAAVSAAASAGFLGTNATSNGKYFGELSDLPKKCTYNIGYCQSLNYIVGFLLLQFSIRFPSDAAVPESWMSGRKRENWMNFSGIDLNKSKFDGQSHDKLFFEQLSNFERRAIEEKVFWVLVSIVEKLLPLEMYGKSLEGAQIEQEILWHWLLGKRGDRFGVAKVAHWVDALERGENPHNAISSSSMSFPNVTKAYIKRKNHTLGAGGENNGMPPLSLATTQWFMTIFINVLPTE
ncbi:hypothetical protein HK096_000489, partial [Nowakowskiella sp. JEL0078]